MRVLLDQNGDLLACSAWFVVFSKRLSGSWIDLASSESKLMYFIPLNGSIFSWFADDADLRCFSLVVRRCARADDKAQHVMPDNHDNGIEEPSSLTALSRNGSLVGFYAIKACRLSLDMGPRAPVVGICCKGVRTYVTIQKRAKRLITGSTFTSLLSGTHANHSISLTCCECQTALSNDCTLHSSQRSHSPDTTTAFPLFKLTPPSSLKHQRPSPQYLPILSIP